MVPLERWWPAISNRARVVSMPQWPRSVLWTCSNAVMSTAGMLSRMWALLLPVPTAEGEEAPTEAELVSTVVLLAGWSDGVISAIDICV